MKGKVVRDKENAAVIDSERISLRLHKKAFCTDLISERVNIPLIAFISDSMYCVIQAPKILLRLIPMTPYEMAALLRVGW